MRPFLIGLLTTIVAHVLALWNRWLHIPLMCTMADVTDDFYSGKAFIGYSGQLKIGQGDSPESFVAVADVTKIKPGNTPASIINKTHLRSPGRTHEKLSTIRELGPFHVEGNYRPDHGSHMLAGGQDGIGAGLSLPALHRSQAENNFLVEVTDADGNTHAIAFRGVVSNYEVGEIALETLVPFMCDVQPLSDWTAGLP